MPQLKVENMSDVKTGFEAIPAQKKVKMRIVAPTEAQKQYETWTSEDGSMGTVKFFCEILEGPNSGRQSQYSAFVHVTKDKYITWGMKTEGRLQTTEEKARDWDAKTYLKDLKRLGDAIGVDFATQPTEDAYGKEFIGDIKLKDTDDGPKDEVRNPRKA